MLDSINQQRQQQPKHNHTYKHKQQSKLKQQILQLFRLKLQQFNFLAYRQTTKNWQATHAIVRNKNKRQFLQIMAGFRKRGCRTRTWFLLKDSLIFVTIMCILQIFSQSSAIAARANISQDMERTKTSKVLEEHFEQLQETLLGTNNNVLGPEETVGAEENQTKEFSVIDVNKIEIEEKIIFKTKDFSRNLFKQKTIENDKTETQQSQSLNVDRTVVKGQSNLKNNKTKGPSETTTNGRIKSKPGQLLENFKNTSQLDISNSSTSSQTPAGKLPTYTGNNTSLALAQANNTSTMPATTMTTTTVINSTNSNMAIPAKSPPARPVSKATPSGGSTSSGVFVPNLYGIRENVMLPSEDPEREAQILYEKTLKEYHVNNKLNHKEDDDDDDDGDNDEGEELHGQRDRTKSSSAAGDVNHSNTSRQRTLHAVCDVWSQKHCHCTGTLGRLSLSCRNIGILAVPVDLPSDTVLL